MFIPFNFFFPNTKPFLRNRRHISKDLKISSACCSNKVFARDECETGIVSFFMYLEFSRHRVASTMSIILPVFPVAGAVYD
jgi:hypothetical protein